MDDDKGEIGEEKVSTIKKTNGTKRTLTKLNSNYLIRKRRPCQIRKIDKDIYVNNKTNFKAYIKLCEKLLELNKEEIVIHALGSAINKAYNLASFLQTAHYNTLELDVKTSSVNLVDDIQPKNDNESYKVNKRTNSAVHIRVYRTAKIGTLRFES